jgi:hypothetical protein
MRNAILLVVVVASVLLQVVILLVPWTRSLLHLAPVTADDVRMALLLGLVPVTIVELGKLARRGVRALRGRGRGAVERAAPAA